MTRTNKLKIVESELINGFCKKYLCLRMPLSKRDLKSLFLEMEPDLVAYDENKGTLYIGEITVSGYNGHSGRDFHIGAARKFAECFSKFYLLNMKENRKEIIKNINVLYHDSFKLKEISCHLIVPKGSRFIKALGYRKKLLETGVMSLDEISLSKKKIQTMQEILEKAKIEMTIKR